jgi:uracil-DNA glycosylase
LRPRAIICLGSIAWKAVLDVLRSAGWLLPRPVPKFGHAVEVDLGTTTMLGCYHVSQQNTFTGRLTPPMIDAVMRRAKTIVNADVRQRRASSPAKLAPLLRRTVP